MRPIHPQALGALVLAALLAVVPGRVSAETTLWTLTASPLAVSTGVRTTFSLTATNEDLLEPTDSDREIGCVVLDVPSNFNVHGAVVTGSSAGGGWHVDSIVGNRVTVHTDSGGERLELLDWVSFTVTATATSTGSLAWNAKAYRRQDCMGTGALLGVPPVVVVSGSTVTPTPAPTPPPTPSPTSTPSPTPTPLLPLPSASLVLPSLGVVPTPTPTPTAAPSAGSPGATATVRPGTSATPTTSATRAATATAPESSQAGGDSGGPPAGPGSAAPDGGPGGQSTTVTGQRPAIRVEFDSADLNLDLGPIGLGESAVVWAVPAAAFAGPGLLLFILVGLQSIGALAWIPAVRRLRGEDPERG